MPAPTGNLREDQVTTFDILMQQRKFNFEQMLKNSGGFTNVGMDGKPIDLKMLLPPELERSF
jgi:hypothetical protein